MNKLYIKTCRPHHQPIDYLHMADTRIKLPLIKELTQHALPEQKPTTSPSPQTSLPTQLPRLLLIRYTPNYIHNKPTILMLPEQREQGPAQAMSPSPQAFGYHPQEQVLYPMYSAPIYYHPVYYHHGVAGSQMLPHQQPPQYAVPEVINRPTNKCHRCGTTETPEWRRGPNGVRTLCNACGLFHAKLVKRKGAALAAEEVLNNKVTKGKNGRRISIKKHMLLELVAAAVHPMPPHLAPMPMARAPLPQGQQGYYPFPIPN